MIKGFTPRLYQQTIFATAVRYNTLVVLPTGMGKTNIFLLLAAQRLRQYPQSKILFVGPTKPLIEQYLSVFKEHFEIDEAKLAVFTGEIAPEKRAQLWESSQIVFSTPQGLENDVISGRVRLEDVSLLGVDEAHRAVGDYAYVFLAKHYMRKAAHPRILALTASPGSDLERIGEVISNLHIEEIEVRSDDDPDVKEYVQEMDVEWVKVKLPPPFLAIKAHLDTFLKERISRLKQQGILSREKMFTNKKDLLMLQAQIRGRIAQGEKDYSLWNAISLLAEIMKVQHASELLETQGVAALHAYLSKMERDAHTSATKAVQNIIRDPEFRAALLKTHTLAEEGMEHPKLVEMQRIVEREMGAKGAKAIIFNQYRDNAADIVEKLSRIKGVDARLFIGQQKKKGMGMSQKEQKELLDRFREGEFNVLVATSVGEEGLDIPRVDLVLFFEPVPSAIRHIQRKGRTGRQEKGRVIILMAEGTRDVAYKWSAHHKEKRMHDSLRSLRVRLKGMLNRPKERPLQSYAEEEEKHLIFVDHREKGSPVVKALLDLGVELRLEQLQNADFILSKRVGVEFKNVQDFIDSILDGRLMDQIREMKRSFERPLIIVEGTEDLFSVRNLHPNAIRGMIANIVVSYGIPLLSTKTPLETAGLLQVIAKREQEFEKREFMPHSGKRVQDTSWLQEYIVSSLPGIGAVLAKPLLQHFRSISAIVNASVDELKKVEGIGKKKAEEIRRILDEEYSPN